MSSDTMSPVRQRALRRDPVHHLLVHRRANRCRVAVIPLERRLRARFAQSPFRQRIEVGRRHAGHDRGLELGQDLRDQLVDPREALDLGRRTTDDHAFFSGRPASPLARSRLASPPPASPATPSTSADRRDQRVSHLIGRLRAVDATIRRPRLIERNHRLRFAPVHLQSIPHDALGVVRPRHQRPTTFGAPLARHSLVAPAIDTVRPHCEHTRRDITRRTSSSSGT